MCIPLNGNMGTMFKTTENLDLITSPIFEADLRRFGELSASRKLMGCEILCNGLNWNFWRVLLVLFLRER